MSAEDYLASLKGLIVAHPFVSQLAIVREEAQEALGLFRARLILQDRSLLELFEHFETGEEVVEVTKYSYHWQDETGRLRRRWDNAPHYPELSTSPHHVHVGPGDRVQPHAQLSLQEVLDFISAAFEGDT